jgi:hypothetical protein
MASGSTCGSPAVSGTTLCYHHSAVKTALGKVVPADRVPYGTPSPIPFVFPEDRASLQINFFLLLQAFNEKRIDQRTSTLMHRILRSMSSNLGNKPLAEDNQESQPAEAASTQPVSAPAKLSHVATNAAPMPQPPQPYSNRAPQEPARNTTHNSVPPPAAQSPIDPSSVFSAATPAPNAAGYPTSLTSRRSLGALSPEGQRILALYNDRP